MVRGLDFCYPYLDDILVFSRDEASHADHLRQLFTRLNEYGMVINISKCVFGVPSVKFLGYSLSVAGTKPLPEKVQAIQNFPVPKTVRELRRFLGMLNFYRRFIPCAAQFQAPLNALLTDSVKGSHPVNFTAKEHDAFIACKNSLCNAALLAHTDCNAKLALITDASDTAIGAALQQFKEGQWQPLAFFSRKLMPSQQKYSPYDRELLAIYEAIKYFRHMVEARNFIIYTDHKPIVFAFHTRKENCSPRQFRHLDFIAQFTTDIRHISGKDNVVADTLSRVEEISQPIDMTALANAQLSDPELQQLLSGNDSSLRLRKVKLRESNADLYYDESCGTPRPYVPKSMRRQVYDSLHSLSHPGANATAKLVAERYVWPSMRKDCREWARSCLACQGAKVTRHVSSPLGNFKLPRCRFMFVHIDIIGPLPPCQEYRYCLTAVDRFTRWPEAIPLRDITAETVAKALLHGWIARYGCPTDIVTDRGRQFESALFAQLSEIAGFQHRRTTSYHPACNGLVERFHRQLKAAITCHASTNWLEILPLVLLGIRATFKEDIQASPAELVYGETLRLPGDFFEPQFDGTEDVTQYTARLKKHVQCLLPSAGSRHHSNRPVFIFKDLSTASHVFLRDDSAHGSFKPAYTGPHQVLFRGDKIFKLLVRGKEVTVSVDRLKPAYILQDPTNTIDPPPPQYTTPTSTVPPTSPSTILRNTTFTGVNKEKDTTFKTRSGRQVRFPDYYRP
ncbi:unnamed protein product [Euphydryas editha]|uniref:RNA-directed DNA polymerase n=1 Tax=Euphydryas editha TaxID=104508 RepID=A0AAU9T829_EUPED|nr:unnamed protein product [Euphydryas editha]